ncbi:nicotinate phosphoribosyltransferase [Entamoeba marina]
MSIITSILDNDLYKFTVSNGYFSLYPYASGVFEFRDRNNMDFPDNFIEKLQEEINHMSTVVMQTNEVTYLESLNILPPTYIEFIKHFKFDPSEVRIELVNKKIVRLPLLAIISELYQKITGHVADIDHIIKVTTEKAQKLHAAHCVFSDFGTRRRFSKEVQGLVVKTLKEHAKESMIGSSNVMFAMQNNIKPIGTHPHEWIMFHAAAFGYRGSNTLGLERWRDLYRGKLCTALTDTFTTDVFFNEFHRILATSYDGIRHDSEDPFAFADKAIAFYKKMNINPLTKNIVFSDSLTADKAVKLQEYCQGKVMCSFGIGTHFTCDTGNDNKPLNIVMKLLNAKNYDEDPLMGCVKLSDAKGKHLGKPEDIQLCKMSLGIKD